MLDTEIFQNIDMKTVTYLHVYVFSEYSHIQTIEICVPISIHI